MTVIMSVNRVILVALLLYVVYKQSPDYVFDVNVPYVDLDTVSFTGDMLQSLAKFE